MKMSIMLGAALLLIGCNKYGAADFVSPEIQSASVIVDATRPGETTAFDIELCLTIEPRSPLTLSALNRLWLHDDEGRAVELEASFDERFDGELLGADDTPHTECVALVNQGTTNGELAPMCGDSVHLVAEVVTMAPRRDVAYTLDTVDLTIACP